MRAFAIFPIFPIHMELKFCLDHLFNGNLFSIAKLSLQQIQFDEWTCCLAVLEFDCWADNARVPNSWGCTLQRPAYCGGSCGNQNNANESPDTITVCVQLPVC